jgi:hypothetical protein
MFKRTDRHKRNAGRRFGLADRRKSQKLENEPAVHDKGVLDQIEPILSVS